MKDKIKKKKKKSKTKPAQNEEFNAADECEVPPELLAEQQAEIIEETQPTEQEASLDTNQVEEELIEAEQASNEQSVEKNHDEPLIDEPQHEMDLDKNSNRKSKKNRKNKSNDQRDSSTAQNDFNETQKSYDNDHFQTPPVKGEKRFNGFGKKNRHSFTRIAVDPNRYYSTPESRESWGPNVKGKKFKKEKGKKKRCPNAGFRIDGSVKSTRF